MSFRNGKEKSPIVVGPCGGQGGSPWDDGVYTSVRQVVITHGAAIDSIRIEYDMNGSSVWAEKHGGSGGTKTDQVKLSYPREVITSVSGYYGSISSASPINVIRSLTFQSSQAKFGPFGIEQGTPFSLPVSGGKIVGFHGRSGWYLDAIGFYLQQLQTPNPSNALLPFRSVPSGHSVADGAPGYDMILAVREKGDNYSVLTSNHSQDHWNRMMSYPSYNSEQGSVTISTPARFGPWGGSGGTIFDDGIHTGVRQINLTRVVGISSIKVLYDRNGQAVWGNKHGVSGGVRPDKVVFDFPSEILTHITGYFGATMIMGPTVIRSVTFHTTKKSHGPYGDEMGTFFSSCLTDGRVVGFHGRAGWYIDTIGVHVLEGNVLPKKASISAIDRAVTEMSASRRSSMLVQAQREIEDEVTYGVVKEPVPMGPGPWGGDGGKPWDDGVYTGVRQIYIMRGEFIGSIQIEYDRSGQSVWSARHGSGGGITHRIKLDYPHEVLNCISGYYNTDKEEGQKALRSLTFVSSRGKYGPFGDEIGTYFTSAMTEGKVVGFHGRSGLFLDAIGVHMQHWLGEKKPTSKYMFSKYLF